MDNPEEHQSPKPHHEKELDQNTHHYKYNEVRTLLSWTAPGRPFRKRSKQFYLTSLLIALLIEIILFLFSQYVLMFVVASVVFLGFALTSVPPKNFHYKISTEGVMIEDNFHLWQELYDFYFRRLEGEETLHIRTQAFLPGEIILTIGSLHREQVKQAILPFLPYREYVKPNFAERSGDWLVRNFPLEKTS
jgi:hypothetical protein